MAVEATEAARARIVRAFTLCDADCEPGYHNPNYLICERCGARIHVSIYEVVTAAGEELTVGRECLKDVLGYIPGPWHKKAEEVALYLRQKTRLQASWLLRVYPGHEKVATAIPPKPGPERRVCPPHRFSTTLLRAGADIGAWTYPIERRVYGGWRCTEVEWLG